MIFVSYRYVTKNNQGFGNTSINADGIYSMDDVREVQWEIEDCVKEKLKTDKSVDVIILTWRNYDTEGK
jgi:hypothetical protein